MDIQEETTACAGEEKELTLTEQMEQKSHGEIASILTGFLERTGYAGAAALLQEDEVGEYADVPVAVLMESFRPMPLSADAESETTAGGITVDMTEEEFAAMQEAAERCAALEAEMSILSGYGIGMDYKKWDAMTDTEVARLASTPGRLKGRIFNDTNSGGVGWPMYSGAAQAEAAKRLKKYAVQDITEQAAKEHMRAHRKERRGEMTTSKWAWRPE